MKWNCYHFLLAAMMVTTGSINTLSIKWADETESKGSDGEVKKFNHPFFQAGLMFVGEFSCFLVFKLMFKIYVLKEDGSEDVKILTKGNRNFNPFVLFIPAICDMTATSTMFIGLNLTYASSFQMLRGSVIIFVGLLSMVFLHRMLSWKQWVGILFIMGGISLVGAADYLSKEIDSDSHSKIGILIGDALIVMAQIVTAIQMVVQEKFVVSHDIPPLQAVGWEGLFGLCVIGLLNIAFYYIRGKQPITSKDGDRLSNPIDAFVQIGNSWELSLASTVLIISIAIFNFAGVSVSKELSATTRMVLDSIRTIVIWAFSLAFLGQIFHWLQVVGFILLLFGMCLYNDIIHCRSLKKRSNELEEESVVN